MPDIPGGPEAPSINHRLDAPRNLTLSLSADGLVLNMALTFVDLGGDLGEPNTVTNYAVWWLSPAVFSEQDITGNPNLDGSPILYTIPYDKLQAARVGPVFSTSSTWTNQVISFSTPYAPYASGGWMYASSWVGSELEMPTSGTNFAQVPKYNPSTTAPVDYPTNVTALTFGTAGTNGRLVAFGWTNPPTTGTAAMKYVQIWFKNFFGNTLTDHGNGYLVAGPTFPCNAGPGGRQGVGPLASASKVLSYDSSCIVLREGLLGPAHNLTICFVPMSDGYVIRNPNDPSSGAPTFTFTGGIT